MRRAMALVVATLAALLALAGPASAHVTVSSPGAVAGEEAVLTFHVPTESDTASTTHFAVQLPAATPFASVDVLAQPGWTFATKTTKLAKPITNDDGDTITSAVSEIDWTADSAASAVKPGEFAQFSVLAGPLPSAATVAFGAVQTYSDGTIVRWNQQAAPGSSATPQYPKPTLTLAAATPASAKSTGSTAPTILAIIALVVAALAVGLVVVGNARRRAA